MRAIKVVLDAFIWTGNMTTLTSVVPSVAAHPSARPRFTALPASAPYVPGDGHRVPAPASDPEPTGADFAPYSTFLPSTTPAFSRDTLPCQTASAYPAPPEPSWPRHRLCARARGASSSGHAAGPARALPRLSPATIPHHLHPPLPLSSPGAHAQRRFPAWFVRGGTSNGLVIRRDALPAHEHRWPSVLAPAMGAPDPLFARQLDDMGSGLSSTSKVVVLSPPSRPDVHVDYTFVQVGIRDGALDLAGNCGNMSSIVGPAAWDQGLIPEGLAADVERDERGDAWACVRIFNTNTSKVIVSRFKVAGQPLAYCPDGDYTMDGVPGTHSLITMSFEDPAGAKTGKALPTGSPTDELRLPDGTLVTASLVDVGNPGVFVSTRAPGLGLDAAQASSLTPAAVEADTQLKTRLEQIRRAGALPHGAGPQHRECAQDRAAVPARRDAVRHGHALPRHVHGPGAQGHAADAGAVPRRVCPHAGHPGGWPARRGGQRRGDGCARGCDAHVGASEWQAGCWDGDPRRED
ncbi:hypothetical protein ACCO45_011532 [Purpureocillium lilacinum]|uniref:Uncharacterized protein n=1 Tax=Purpureocillium lilacinum TaxID=33203 RepID=A0ACC4DDM3_PURLI